MTGAFEHNSAAGMQADSGGPKLDPVSGVFDAAQGALAGVKSMQQGAEKMVEAASSGGFRTDPEGVRKVVNVCDRMLDKLNATTTTFANLAQNPKLGSSPYAQQVSQHVRLSADGPQGIIPQLDLLKQTLMALREALFRASGQYAEAEEAAKMRQA